MARSVGCVAWVLHMVLVSWLFQKWAPNPYMVRFPFMMNDDPIAVPSLQWCISITLAPNLLSGGLHSLNLPLHHFIKSRHQSTKLGRIWMSTESFWAAG